MKYFLSLLLSLLILLPGCSNRFSDWAADHAEQGKVRGVPKDRVLSHVRTIRIYNDFSTVGIFDALWLADSVREAYVDVYAEKYQLPAEKKDEMMRGQLAENDNFISFYIFSYIPDSGVPLNDKNSPWTIALKVNGKLYAPANIQTAELSPEYHLFLKRIFNKHKNIHLVKFAVRDEEGKAIITKNTRLLEIRLSTDDRSTMLTWHLDKHQHLAAKHSST